MSIFLKFRQWICTALGLHKFIIEIGHRPMQTTCKLTLVAMLLGSAGYFFKLNNLQGFMAFFLVAYLPAAFLYAVGAGTPLPLSGVKFYISASKNGIALHLPLAEQSREIAWKTTESLVNAVHHLQEQGVNQILLKSPLLGREKLRNREIKLLNEKCAERGLQWLAECKGDRTTWVGDFFFWLSFVATPWVFGRNGVDMKKLKNGEKHLRWGVISLSKC
jgi:hypothetical protein